ncbi:MAG: DUF1501 domain-containing protein [Saprospiraceae bacterium]|nr:DUF1501 domain-containing protein [Saprospiraceae bacterium]
MKRRQFLRAGSSSILSLPLAFQGIKIGAFRNTIFDQLLSDETDRVFVLIQMNGGNDGLNMVIPLDQYDKLMNVRSNIMLPEADILSLTDTLGFHPRMTGMKSLFDDGRLNIVQNVGYENQNRSHFRSTDIWDTGSRAEEVLTSGWIGRFMDQRHAGYPEGYPNEANPHPIAITLGPTVSETCQGMAANFSIAIQSADSLREIPGQDGQHMPEGPYGLELEYIRQIKRQTNQYADLLVEASEKGVNQSSLYPDPGNNQLADQLRIVASLIAGGLETKIYVVNINGFDTHANQVEDGDTTIGDHSTLLGWLSEAMEAFMDDVQKLGLSKRVIAATRSEFGRKIVSNGSFGTDHGDAAPLMVFGECVNGGIIGENPIIGDQVDPRDGVAMQMDFKNVFASILVDWLGASESDIAQIFSHDYQHLDIVNPCDATTPARAAQERITTLKAYPNPFIDRLVLEFHSMGGHAEMVLLGADGREVSRLVDGAYQAGPHRLEIAVPEMPAGMYYYRFRQDQVSTGGSLVHF